MLIILQRKTNFLKKTLPYWKYWKKTERLTKLPIIRKKKTLPYWKYWKKTERLQIFYLKQKKLLKKEARLSLMKLSPN